MSAKGHRAPDISVVVRACGREARLAFALEALTEQTLDAERFEVVVVREGRVPSPTMGALEGVTVRFLEQPQKRQAATLNVGWRAAAADWVAFTTEECRPAPGWLEALLAAAHLRSAFTQGRTEPDPDERQLLGGLAHGRRVVGQDPWHEACNIAYPVDLLTRLGGFDERLGGRYGADADLALRARASGASPTYRHDAVVWRGVRQRHLVTALWEAAGEASVARVLSRHPAQRGAAKLGLFRSDAQLRALAAAGGGLLLRRRKALAALAAAPYFELHSRAYGRAPRRLAIAALAMPHHLLVDLAGGSAALASALRWRLGRP